MPKPPGFLARLLGGGGRAAEDARLAREARGAHPSPRGAPRPPETPTSLRPATRAPETVAPLRAGPEGGSEVAATRRFRQERVAQHELAQTHGPTPPGASPDEVAAARQRALRNEQHVAERSHTRGPESPTGRADAPGKPREPLFSDRTKSNLARTGAYTALGLGGAAAATGIAQWWTDNVTLPRSDARTKELDAQTPKVDDAGACAKIVRAPGQSTLLDDAACRAEKMREYLQDRTFRDYYERFFLDGKDNPGGVDVTPITTPPPNFADKVKTFAVGVLLLSLATGGAFLAWRYYKAHPEKFKKKGGSRVENPAKPKPAASPA